MKKLWKKEVHQTSRNALVKIQYVCLSMVYLKHGLFVCGQTVFVKAFID